MTGGSVEDGLAGFEAVFIIQMVDDSTVFAPLAPDAIVPAERGFRLGGSLALEPDEEATVLFERDGRMIALRVRSEARRLVVLDRHALPDDAGSDQPFVRGGSGDGARPVISRAPRCRVT